MEKAYLKSNIVSHASGKHYGSAGELVTIVSIRQHVVIVESLKGLRFPTSSENLLEIKPNLKGKAK